MCPPRVPSTGGAKRTPCSQPPIQRHSSRRDGEHASRHVLTLSHRSFALTPPTLPPLSRITPPSTPACGQNDTLTVRQHLGASATRLWSTCGRGAPHRSRCCADPPSCPLIDPVHAGSDGQLGCLAAPRCSSGETHAAPAAAGRQRGEHDARPQQCAQRRPPPPRSGPSLKGAGRPVPPPSDSSHTGSPILSPPFGPSPHYPACSQGSLRHCHGPPLPLLTRQKFNTGPPPRVDDADHV